jgi:hypothetical protein
MMARSRADERLLKRVGEESPESLGPSTVEPGPVMGRLLAQKPQSKAERRAAKKKAAPRTK